MSGNPLPDEDHISRYCRPGAVGQNGLPLAAAFQLRAGEDHLSVNWLEHFQADNLETAVAYVREVFRMKGYSVKPTGRFAVLNVETAKDAVSTVAGRTARINHLPLDDDLSHSGIFGYTVDDLAVAAELKTLVGRVDVYAAT